MREPHLHTFIAQQGILLVLIADLVRLGLGLKLERTQTLVHLLQDAPLADAPVERKAVGQLAILVPEAGGLVTEALVGRIDLVRILSEVAKLVLQLCEFLVGLREAYVCTDDPVLFSLESFGCQQREKGR